MKLKQICRREALRRTALIMGGAVTAPTMLGILTGCTVSNEPNWTPAFFDQDQAVTVMDIVDIIIPKTDTPGALEVGVPKFIESMVQDIYEENRQTEFMEGLGEFISSVESEQGSPFIELDKETKVIIVTSLNKAAVNHTNEGVKEKFYMTVKELSVSGFCLSEAGATQVLKYDKVPGEYQGCVPFEEVGRTWAT